MLRATLLAVLLLPLGCRGTMLDVSEQNGKAPHDVANVDLGPWTLDGGGGDHLDGGCGGGNVDLGPWVLDGGGDWNDAGYPVDLGPWPLDGGYWPLDGFPLVDLGY